MESSEETQNGNPTIDKNDKNKIFLYSSDMDFKVSVSACGAIRDNQA
jgi:hypothetical protein